MDIVENARQLMYNSTQINKAPSWRLTEIAIEGSLIWLHENVMLKYQRRMHGGELWAKIEVLENVITPLLK